MNPSVFTLSGSIVDVVEGRIFPGTVVVSNGRIESVTPGLSDSTRLILPGLVDAHVHIESSMLIPSEFARLAVVHGTVATVSDPHEIGNVLGVPGVQFMINNGKKVPFKFMFGAPSCVPATAFETSGETIGLKELEELLRSDDIGYLSEMMNFPGVINGDEQVMQKLALAKKFDKPVDGHAPGVTGEQARKYIHAGITTDHECFTKEEALEKIGYGMKVLIREGSAAKNFEALSDLILEKNGMIMLCSDDKHPDDLVRGHINLLVKRSLQKGYDPVMVLRTCTLNPVRHYRLNAGLLQPGDPADLIVVSGLEDFTILQTYIDGNLVAENGRATFQRITETPFNNFNSGKITPGDISVTADQQVIRVIQAFDGQLVTEESEERAFVVNNRIISDTEKDVLKVVVKNRYRDAPPAVGFVRGFTLKKGAMASSVAHDSHNIIAVGVSDDLIAEAINSLVEARGGIAFIDEQVRQIIPLPFGGIMSGDDGYRVADQYQQLELLAKQAGSRLNSPYMTLSFMALLVIPQLKISDRGLFDGTTFSFTSVFKKH